jgi:hypothetical protein
MTASGPVPVAGVMSARATSLRASLGVRGAYLDHMLVNVVLVRVMQVPVVKIIDMAIVANSRVTAAGAVHMRMICMNAMIRTHGIGSLFVHWSEWSTPRGPKSAIDPNPK